MRYIAQFTPQAWINDYATDVDPEGQTKWDATAHLLENVNEGDVIEAIQSEGCWLDEDDVLKGDENAPEWVKEWSGPFTITVEREEGEQPTQVSEV